MQQKKIKLVILFLLTICFGAIQATTMNVKIKTGGSTSFDLTQMQRMVFSSGSLVVVNKSGDTNSFLLNEIQSIEYTYSTSIETLKLTKCEMIFTPSQVRDVCTLIAVRTFS